MSLFSCARRCQSSTGSSLISSLLCTFVLAALGAVSVQSGVVSAQSGTIEPAQDARARRAALGKILDRELASFVRRSKPVGVAVGVLRGKEVAMRFDGVANKKTKRAVDADTLFEIGSITKVFNGILLADMERRGKLRCKAALSEFLPEGTRVPEFEGVPIRLVDLVTHRSGLPRMPSNIRPKDGLDPYADYSEKLLLEYLRGARLERRPDTRYLYSNLGAALLGVAIASHAGKGWESLCVERICKPLGLASTRAQPDEKLAKRCARGHFKNGLAGKAWGFDAFVAAGGLRSSLRDMLRFASCCADVAPCDLQASIAKSRTVLAKGRGSTRMAYAWHVRTLELANDKRHDVFQHGGRTGGFSTSIAVLPSKRCAVVVLVNQAIGLGELPSRVLKAAALLSTSR